MDRSDIAMLAPDQQGAAVRVNHGEANCRGKSRSLSIWRNSDDSIGFKFYRCGEGGRIEDKPSLFKSAPKNKKLVYGMPDDLACDWAEMPVESVAYLNKFKFSESFTKQRKIGWSAREGRLIFPASNLTVLDPGWQGKSFDGEPRYLTRTKYPDFMYTHYDRKTKEVVITEDMLSAMRANEILSSFALLGTNLTDAMLEELRSYHKFYIWLDNDNAIVKKAQLQIYNRLSLFGQAFVIKSEKEPKECSSAELIEVIKKIDGTNPWS